MKNWQIKNEIFNEYNYTNKLNKDKKVNNLWLIYLLYKNKMHKIENNLLIYYQIL